MSKHKHLGAIVVVSGILITIFATFFFVFLPYVMTPSVSLSLGLGVFDSMMAVNDTERSKGLSGVTELAADKALIMVFPAESKWKIWMNGMKMPIDIIWLDQNKTVIYIVKNALPDASGNKSFEPKKLAKYVIEVPAGTVDNVKIKINQVANFQYNEANVR